MKTLLLALLMIAAPAYAAEQPPRRAAAVMAQPAAVARLEIKAPTSMPSRSGFAVNAEAEGVKGLFWLVFPASADASLVRIPSFPDGEINPLIYLGGIESGELNFVVAGVTNGGKAIAASHTVKVGDGPAPRPNPVPPDDPAPPDPTPPPRPDPDPPQPIPDSKLGIDVLVRNAAAKVSDRNKAENAKALAEICEVIESQIAAGTIADAAAAQKEFKAKILALGVLRMRPWLSVVTELRDEFDRLVLAGKLKTMQDYQTAFAEAAAGLRLVRSGTLLKFGGAY